MSAFTRDDEQPNPWATSLLAQVPVAYTPVHAFVSAGKNPATPHSSLFVAVAPFGSCGWRGAILSLCRVSCTREAAQAQVSEQPHSLRQLFQAALGRCGGSPVEEHLAYPRVDPKCGEGKRCACLRVGCGLWGCLALPPQAEDPALLDETTHLRHKSHTFLLFVSCHVETIQRSGGAPLCRARKEWCRSEYRRRSSTRGHCHCVLD